MSDSGERAGHGAIPEIGSVLATSDENSRLGEFLEVCRLGIEEASARGEYGHDLLFQWEDDQVVAVSRLRVLLEQRGYAAVMNRVRKFVAGEGLVDEPTGKLTVSWGDGDQRVNQQTVRMS